MLKNYFKTALRNLFRNKTYAVINIGGIAIGLTAFWLITLYIADEPTGNLDSSNGNEVMQLLTDLNEQGTTIIMVTHSEHDARYSHRIVRMLDGQTVTENILV